MRIPIWGEKTHAAERTKTCSAQSHPRQRSQGYACQKRDQRQQRHSGLAKGELGLVPGTGHYGIQKDRGAAYLADATPLLARALTTALHGRRSPMRVAWVRLPAK